MKLRRRIDGQGRAVDAAALLAPRNDRVDIRRDIGAVEVLRQIVVGVQVVVIGRVAADVLEVGRPRGVPGQLRRYLIGSAQGGVAGHIADTDIVKIGDAWIRDQRIGRGNSDTVCKTKSGSRSETKRSI